MTVKQTAGRDQLGAFAPKFAQLNDDVLFGEVWNRTEELPLRDRSLVTVVALMAQGLVDSSFRYHLATARKNGITKEEIAEVITHAAFYAGWPKAWAAFNMAKEVWADDGDGADGAVGAAAAEGADVAGGAAAANGMVEATAAGADVESAAGADAAGTAAGADAGDNGRAAYERTLMFPVGQPNDAFAQYFDGQSYLAPVSTEQVGFFNVTFEPGCRNHWHIHHATQGGGQMLVCVGGRGWYQEWGKPAQEMLPGDVVHIPAEAKHWHGAAADSWFSHLAFEIDGQNASNEWCEPVDPQEYAKLG